MKQALLNDSDFVKNIETTYPNDTLVFQLPYIAFPESPPLYKTTDYSHFRGYLHSTNIKWSYEAIKWRKGDYWQQVVTAKPVNEMIRDPSFAGFSGLYVDSTGYQDKGQEILNSISSTLKLQPIISKDRSLYFFDMSPYNTILASQYTPEEIESKKYQVLYP